MRTTPSRRPIATSLLLVGAMLLLSGCGDAGNQLPAGMSGSSSASSGGTPGDLLGSDPGPLDGGVRSGVDDPVLAGYDGVEELGALSSDDPFAQATQDWSETEGSLSTIGSGLDDLGLDEPMPVGYGSGYGRGLDDGWGGLGGIGGYGNGVLSAASYGGGWGGDAGLMDAGFSDPGLDMGLEDPGFVDGGFDAGFVDAGMDVGFVDAGVDAGFDPGLAADPGFVDPGFADVGAADPGFDAGFVDAGVADVGGFDAGIAVF